MSSIEQRAKVVEKAKEYLDVNYPHWHSSHESAGVMADFHLAQDKRKDQVIAELVKVARDSKGFIRAQNFDGKHSESTCSCTICDMIKDVQVVIERAEKELKEVSDG